MPACGAAVEDIEDIVNKNDPTPNDRVTPRKVVLPRVKRKTTKTNIQEQEERPIADSYIPGTQNVFVRTWGCSHNNSDSEYMAGQLAAYGYRITGELIQCACIYFARDIHKDSIY